MRTNMGLYRGKRTDNGEWVEGAYGVLGKGTDIESHVIMVSTLSNGTVDRFYFTDVPVDPSTLGECTGLPDKNGRMVFESDILKSEYGVCVVKFGAYTEGVEERIHEVLTTIHPVGWFVEYPTGEQAGWDWVGSADYFEVIGNLADNPELLEVGK